MTANGVRQKDFYYIFVSFLLCIYDEWISALVIVRGFAYTVRPFIRVGGFVRVTNSHSFGPLYRDFSLLAVWLRCEVL